MARYCKNCGTQLPDGAAFCPECGEKAPAQQPKTRFCRSCGAKLPAGAAFCPECGEPVPIEIAAPKGATVTVSDEPPEELRQKPKAPKAAEKKVQSDAPKETPAPAKPKKTAASKPKAEEESPKSAAKAPQKAEDKQPTKAASAKSAKPKAEQPKAAASKKTAKPAVAEEPAKATSQTTPKKRGLSLFLVLVMLVELGIAAFKYPGFLVPEPDEPYDTLSNWGQTGSTGNSNSGNSGSGTNTGKTTVTDDEWVPAPVSRISVTFTEKELTAAPKHETAVSQEQLQVTCGDLAADFCHDWNLSGEDTLIVRDLPQKEDEKAGYVLLGYDVSLASGQDEFPTYVKLTIPRTATSESDGFCATYNEETGQYERLYYEISEDGQSYIIYTDHLSKKFEVRYTEAVIKRIKKVIEEGEKLNTDLATYLSGIFGYQMNDRALFDKDVMNLPVTADLYKLFSKRTYDASLSMTEMIALAENVPEGQLGLMLPLSKELYGANDDAGAQLSLLTVGTAGRELLTGNKLSAVPEGMGKLAGGINAIISLHGTLNKMSVEVANGSDIGESILNNKLGVLGTAIGVAGVFVSGPLASLLLAVAGLGCWLGSKAYDYYAPRDIDIQERNYRDYYAPENGVARNFRYNLDLNENTRKSNVDSIRVLENLNAAQNAELMKLINEKLVALPGVSPLGGHPRDPIPYEWATVIKKLYELCEEDPQSLSDVLAEFYNNYAQCFSHYDGFSDYTYYQYIDEFMTNRGDKHDRVVPTEAEQDKQISYMIHDLMGWLTDLHRELMWTYEFNTKVEVATLIEQELLPLLNTKIVFTLEDTALGSKQSLTDSIFNLPYKTNDKYTLEGKISDYASNTFPNLVMAEAPMRFLLGTEGNYQEVEKPALEPKAWFSYSKELRDIGVFSTVRNTHYYPYVDNFLPKITKGSSEIFSCTVYHYLLMGAPRAIRFHDMEGELKDQDIPFKLSAPGQDGVIRVNLQVKGTRRDYRGDAVTCEFMEHTTNDSEFNKQLSNAYTELIQGIDLAFNDDGIFSAGGSGTYDIKLKGRSNAVTPTGQITLGGSGNSSGSSSSSTSTSTPAEEDYAWKGTATVSFNLTGSTDQKTGKKTAKVTGTVKVHIKYVKDDGYAKNEHDYDATFEGSTDMFLTFEKDDGTEVLRFVFHRDGAGNEGKTELKSKVDIKNTYYDGYREGESPNESYKDMFSHLALDFVRVKKQK